MTHITQLVERAGRYAGHGIDHQHQPFHGELALKALSQGAVALCFRATGIDGTVYRDEHGLVALDEAGRLSLWLVESGSDGMSGERCLQYTLRHGAPPEGTLSSLVFGRGDRADEAEYRAEVVIDLWPEGTVGYRHAWGHPHAEYAPRLTVKMSPVEKGEEGSCPRST